MRQSIPIASWRDVGQALALFDGFFDDWREPEGQAVIETDKFGKLSIQIAIAVSEKPSTKVPLPATEPRKKLNPGGKRHGKM